MEEAIQYADDLRASNAGTQDLLGTHDTMMLRTAETATGKTTGGKKKKRTSKRESVKARARQIVERTALMHDGAKDNAQLSAFQGSGLKGKEFGRQWNKAFPCSKLTTAEAKAVLPYFDVDGSGDIDGAEFLVKFFDLSQKMKREQRGEHRVRSAYLEQKRLEQECVEQRKEEARVAAALKIEFTKEDKKEALRKLKKAALEYKTRWTPRSMGGMQGLSGFDGTKLSPVVLRSLLQRTFDLNLSRKELGALIVAIQGHGSQVVDGKNFVTFFHRLGAKAQKQQKHRLAIRREWDALVEEAAEQKRRENEDFDVVDGGFGAYHPLDLESAYAKLGERATWQVRSRPLTQQFTEGGPLNPRDFRRRVRSEFDVDLTERELSAVVASLNEGGADADAELVDGQRFLKRMNMLNSTARRLPRVEKTPVAGDWIRNERYNARPITADRYTNQDLFSPKRQFAKFTAFDPCGVDRQTLMRVTGRTPSPVKKKALRQRLGVDVSRRDNMEFLR